MLFQKNKTFIIFSILIVLTLQTFTAPIYGFRSQFINTSNDYESLLLTNFDSLSDIESALIASDINPNLFSLYSSEITRWKNEIASSLRPNTSEREIAIAIGEYLHDNVFIRYKISATTLKEVFEEGLFNCLSATILVNLLLRSFGIEAESIVLPTHIYTVTTLDGRSLEIENTIRNGLAISEDKTAQKRFNELTGFDYKQGNKKKNVISWYQTIGLLYSNRSYFDAKQKDYYTAFQNMMKAQVFLSKVPSEYNNLSAGYLNYSYYTYKNSNQPLQKYLKTLSVLEEGMSRFPNYENLKGNYLKGVDLVVEKMIVSDFNPETIDQVLTKSKQYLKAQDFQKIQKGRYIRGALYSLRTNINFDKALDQINQLSTLTPDDKEVKSLMEEYIFIRVKNQLDTVPTLKVDKKFIQDIQQFDTEITENSLGCYFTGIAEKQYNNQQFENAIATMLEAKSILENSKMILQNGFAYAVNAAQHFLKNNNTHTALQYYNKSLIFKKDRQVINNMSILYEQLIRNHLADNKLSEAKKIMKEALGSLPNNPRLKNLHNEFQLL